MKNRIYDFLLRRLFGAITTSDIVENHPKTGAVLIDGKPIQPDELRQMQAEIKDIEGSRIWKLISETTKHRAEERIFKNSLVIEDIRFGKAMLYNLSLQKSIMDALREKK